MLGRRVTAWMGLASAVVLSSCATVLGAAPESQTSPGLHTLAFSAKTFDGTYFSGETLKGKPAVLWFWAPWSPTCRDEAPEVARAAHTHPSVTFVGVAARDRLPAMEDFVARYDLHTLLNLADVDGAVWRHFDITRQPAFAFIGPNGSARIVRGVVTGADLEALLAALEKA